ncbi:5-(carboxyamino)imidazole ribonucleotide synthase [Pediococcus acidilactici]|uniref:5-(carboxyamino)imidazole ribonucleotide synthase n=1 Tax=Pediococcus acidilactici TaxID=1254 RepID=UPI001CCF6BAE|nr:5-(carboxyamino)imidazole ribonucleotide synthase [Pediococcus acidilactici]
MKSSGEAGVYLPPATIGIIGGGQLGQMIALAAKAMGYKVGILDPTPNCPAGQVSDFQIVAAYNDQQALLKMAERSDVLTYEFENVDLASLEAAQKLAALPQGTNLLYVTSDRLREKHFLASHDLPITPYQPVSNPTELNDAITKLGYPCILKSCEGGYDGHGQQDINSEANLPAGRSLISQTPCILEKRQKFSKELSVMVTRSRDGQVRCFPVAENIHHNHILHQSIVPARVTEEVQQKAQKIARQIAQGLCLRGVLGIEFFMLADDRLLVNELAPRPHNSGHYSIEACNISQFEAHVRSICGLEIPKITQHAPAVMVNLLGQHLTLARKKLTQRPNWHFHDYGKAESRVNRKMGHITLLGELQPSLDSIQAEKIWEISNEENDVN